MKTKLICSICKKEPHSDDSGYGIKFKKNDEILCKTKRISTGTITLHYHDIAQINTAIAEYTPDDGQRYIRSNSHRVGVVEQDNK